MSKKKEKPITTKEFMLQDKKMLYVILFIVLIFAAVFIDACVLGKFAFNKKVILNTMIIGMILSALMCFMTFYTIALSNSLQVLLINKFEHLQKIEDRYKLVSYVAINEMRSYVYTAAIISTFLGCYFIETSAPISIPMFVILHVFGYFVIARPLRQPEFFVEFLSEEYYLLLGKSYYQKRKKDNLLKIREALK